VGATVGSGGSGATATGGGGNGASGTGASGPSGGSGGGGATGNGSPGSGGTAGGGAKGSGGVIGGGGITGSGGAAASGGGKGNGGVTGSGGTGGKPDQGSLPAITIHLAGDSTMSDYTAATTQEGWGQELGQYFISKVTIDNQAQPGANIQTFYTGPWKTLINNVKAGDYVMAAFGINDSGTTHGPVTPTAFQTQMGVMADEVAAKKAIFIPTTSSPLQVWEGGQETNARLQPYCDATIALGMSKGLLVDDLNALGLAYYNMIGQTAAAALTFNGDKAHFDKQGATEMALLASQELAKINSPLAAYLK
jgi:lysophospholipase L1-like esterase